MYVEEYIARERQRERLREAEQERAASRLAEFRRLEKRQNRAERDLLNAWERMEHVRARLEAI